MSKLYSHLVLATLALAGLLSSLHAESDGDATSKSEAKPEPKTEAKSETKLFEEPPLSVTAHSIKLGGKTLRYHATAGYLVLKEEEGKPLVKQPEHKPAPESKPETEANKTKDGLKAKAKVFFVAYTLDDAGDPATRPLT